MLLSVVNASTYNCRQVILDVYRYSCMYFYILLHVYINVHVYIHVHIHICKHLYVYTQLESFDIYNLLQVEHIFSDKTGTLTENKMVFKACSVGDMLFKEPDISNSNIGKFVYTVGLSMRSGRV